MRNVKSDCLKIYGGVLRVNNYKLPLTQAEVDQIYQKLTPIQKEFIDSFEKRGKKSKWLEALAKKKGILVNENMSEQELIEKVNDWVLVDILDGGEGNRPYKCECGMPLRYQYIVSHQSKEQIYKLGETCLENYTNLSCEIIRDIKKGFHVINLERDELLLKILKNYKTSLEKYKEIEIPNELLEQISYDIPLTNKQEKRLEKLLWSKWQQQKNIQKQEEPIKAQKQISSLEYRSNLQLLKNARNMNNVSTCTTYEELVELHLDDLKQVRLKEENIPKGLFKDWVIIQDIVRSAKRKEEFDYARFKLLLNNLKIPLKID